MRERDSERVCVAYPDSSCSAWNNLTRIRFLTSSSRKIYHLNSNLGNELRKSNCFSLSQASQHTCLLHTLIWCWISFFYKISTINAVLLLLPRPQLADIIADHLLIPIKKTMVVDFIIACKLDGSWLLAGNVTCVCSTICASVCT